tara:strand:- start:64 stop:333 length:270 start_codon:yes stop_codon:yes gene_type:complete
MIDTDKYEGHTPPHWIWIDWIGLPETLKDVDKKLMQDAPLLLEFIEKVVEEWARPNACPKSFGKEVRQLMYEYGLITFNEETRRYEVKE